MPPHSCTETATTNATNYDELMSLKSWFGSSNLLCTGPNTTALQQLSLENTQNYQCYQLQGSVKGCSSQYPPSTKNHSSAYKKKSRGRVSFYPQDQIIEIPSIKDLSSEEFKAVHMTKEEMGKIHEECWRLVDLMNSGIEYEDQEGFSKRGLVDLKDDSVERRRKMRDQAYRIVFGVQKFHSGNVKAPGCMLDVTEITANLYHKAAARSQEEAYEAAWFDAIAARV